MDRRPVRGGAAPEVLDCGSDAAKAILETRNERDGERERESESLGLDVKH